MGRSQGNGAEQATVRKKGTGTFDRSTNTWRLRGEGVQISVSQLSKLYREDIPRTERDSRPYWRRYLQDRHDAVLADRKASSPLPERIRSIEAMIERLRGEGRSGSVLERLERQLEEAINVPAWDIDHTDMPILHPDVQERADAMGLCDAGAIMLAATEPPTTTTNKVKDSLKHEADLFIQRHRDKGHKGWFSVRQAVDLLLGVTGEISVHDVTVHHYREFNDKVKANDRWNDRSKRNMQCLAKQFLSRVEADHNTNYGFLRNKDYNLHLPDGQKEQYTIEQVKTALEHATGINRMSLLLGLNAGLYWGDIVTLTKDMFKDIHLHRHRDKLSHRKTKVVGCWLLWEETRAALQLNDIPSQRGLWDRWRVFQQEHSLPGHKALRKTTAQLIEDYVGEYDAKLFRCVISGDTHSKSYIRPYTPEQVKRLDKALRLVAKMYGIK